MAARDILKQEDDGFAGKIASNKKVKETVERILKLKEESANINADIKSAYDAAANEGIDRAALKAVVKMRAKDVSEEHKVTVNSYLKALGDLPLFATAMAN